MAVTKLGAQLMSLEKRALFDMGRQQSAPPPAPSLWQRIGRGMGRVGSFVMPAMMGATTAAEIASGQNSVGGGLGELGGGLAGWSFGTKTVDSLTRNMRQGKLKGALGVAGGILGSMFGGGIGSSVGNAILPFRRKPPEHGTWLNETGDGWNG